MGFSGKSRSPYRAESEGVVFQEKVAPPANGVCGGTVSSPSATERVSYFLEVPDDLFGN